MPPCGAVERARVLHEQVEGLLEQVGRHARRPGRAPARPPRRPRPRARLRSCCRRPSTSRRCSAGCRTPGRGAPDRRRRGSSAPALVTDSRCSLLRHQRPADLDGPLQDRRRDRAARGAARSSPGSRARRRAGRRAAASCARPAARSPRGRSPRSRRRPGPGASISTALRMGAMRVAQLVRQHRQEFVLAPIDLLQLRERAGPFAFQLPAVGVVGDDRHAAVHGSPGVQGGRDDEVHPAPAQAIG